MRSECWIVVITLRVMTAEAGCQEHGAGFSAGQIITTERDDYQPEREDAED